MNTPLARLRELIKKNKLDAALISSHSNIVYLTNYSGFSKEEREAYLLITKNEQYILDDVLSLSYRINFFKITCKN